MIFKSSLLLSVCIIIAFTGRAQNKISNIDLACKAMSDRKWNDGVKFGIQAWNEKKDPFTAYLLAFAYHKKNDAPDSKDYATYAVQQSKASKTPIFNDKQLGMLKFILNPAPVAPNSPIDSYTVTTKDGPIYGMSYYPPELPPLLGDILQASQSKPVTQADIKAYNDAHNQLLQIPNNLTPVNAPLRDQLGAADAAASAKGQYQISWSTDGYSSAKMVYDSVNYPELYHEWPFLQQDFARLYSTSLNGHFDPQDTLVLRYKLNPQTLTLFIEEVFPEIYYNREHLDAYIKELSWEAPAEDH